jgi:hypothetical protein
MRTAATIFVMVATFVAFSLMVLKPDAGVTVRKKKAKGAGGPPIISSFNTMPRHGRSSPPEEWYPDN